MGTIDDQNAVIKYSNDWGRIVDTNAFNDTTTWTEVPGETVTLQFTGTGISVYGEIASTGRRGAPVSAYSIDGGPSTTFTGTQTSKNQYNVLFFQSPQLASGGHTLVITTKSENLFFLDYFQITNSPPSLSNPNPAAGPTSGTTVTVTQSAPTPSQVASSAQMSSTPFQSAPSSTTTMGSATAETSDRSLSFTNPGTPLVTVTVTSSNGTPSDPALSSVGGASSHSKTGPIVGAVVGGLFLLALLCFLALYLCRRKRKGILPLSSSGHTGNSASLLRPGRMTEVTPFHLSEGNTSDISANALALLNNQSPDTVSHTQYSTLLSSESAGSQALAYMSSSPSANAAYTPVSSAMSMSGATSEKPGMTGRRQFEAAIVRRSNEGLVYDPPPQYMG